LGAARDFGYGLREAGFLYLETRFHYLEASFHFLEAGFHFLEARFDLLKANFHLLKATFRFLEAGFHFLEANSRILEASFLFLETNFHFPEAEFLIRRSRPAPPHPRRDVESESSKLKDGELATLETFLISPRRNRSSSRSSWRSKMEAGNPTVSIDLLVRSLLAAGADRRELGRIVGTP